MLVCHCYAISDRRIRAAVREGARTCREIQRRCFAGSGCGTCRKVVQEIIRSEVGSLEQATSEREVLPLAAG